VEAHSFGAKVELGDVSVLEALGARDGLLQGWIGDTSGTAELVGEDLLLEGELGAIRGVLPLAAAAALSKVDAWRLGAVFRGFEDAEEATTREVPSSFEDRYFGGFVLEAAGYEDNWAVLQSADRGSAVGHAMQGHAHRHGLQNSGALG
jgi:hypothetical protein